MKASGCYFSFVMLQKKSNKKKKASQNDASARSAGSYAFVDAPHHSKS
jgi:hypothetical protein